MSYYLSNINELSRIINSKSYRTKNQDRVLTDVKPTHPGAIWNPEEWFRITFSNLEIKILNSFIALSNKYSTIYVSESSIAKYAGCCIRTVIRAIKKLKSFGLLDFNYRHLKTNTYKVSSYFMDINLRKKMCKLIKSLWYLPKTILGVTNIGQLINKSSLSEYVTQLDKLNKNLFISSSSYTSNYIRTPRQTSGSHNFNLKKERVVVNSIQDDIKRIDKEIKTNPRPIDSRQERSWATKNPIRCCDNCFGKYCCGSCELNKRGIKMRNSDDLRMCDKVRKQKLELGISLV